MVFDRSSRGHGQRSEAFSQLVERADDDGSGGSPPEATVIHKRVFTGETRTHAMKNCLSVINGVAYLCNGELSERGRVRMAHLLKASARLLELIDEDIGQEDEAPLKCR